jgi:hypothetical protein
MLPCVDIRVSQVLRKSVCIERNVPRGTFGDLIYALPLSLVKPKPGVPLKPLQLREQSGAGTERQKGPIVPRGAIFGSL